MPIRNYLIIAIAFFTILVTTIGCNRDKDAVIVDFDKTLTDNRSEIDNSQGAVLNVAVAAMISPKETFSYYQEMLDYIGAKMDRKVNLVQRKTYGEVNELFQKGQVDLAFICSGPYAVDKEKFGFEALATPLVRNEPYYQSYLIVNNTSPYKSFSDLRGKVFAFTDPDSNTGALVPQYWLSKMGETPESYFESFSYTYSHDNSIMAVARALVDGATVDGHKWEYFQARNPIYSSRTRVIKKSEPFGSPPLVASVALPTKDKEIIKQIVFNMHLDAGGKEIIDKLMIERFVLPDENWYAPIRQMKIAIKPSGNLAHAAENF